MVKDGWKGLSAKQRRAAASVPSCGKGKKKKSASEAIPLTPKVLEQIVALDNAAVLYLMKIGRRGQHVGHLLNSISNLDEEAAETAAARWASTAPENPLPPATPHTQLRLR